MHPIRSLSANSIRFASPPPQALRPAHSARIQTALADFWHELAAAAVQIAAQDHLAAHARLVNLRRIVLICMVGLNGADLPDGLDGVAHLLGPSQRDAIQKTLAAPAVDSSAWIGQAVALVVIYRWYAPQLVEKFALVYPQQVEAQSLDRVRRYLPDWPLAITSE